MKYVWIFHEATDDPNMVPVLCSSKKKAMYYFNDEVNSVRDRRLDVTITKTKDGASASWKDVNGYEHDISVFKEVVR